MLDSNILYARIYHILLSEALGDALGAPHELKTYNGHYSGKLELQTVITRRFNTPITLTPGSITDDTQMTHALINSILRCRNLDYQDTVLSYINFANTKPDSLGKNTRALFRSIKTVKGYGQRRSKVDPNNQSDGTLMRASALAYLPFNLNDQDLYQLIALDTQITNSHINNIVTGYLYVKLFHPSRPELAEIKELIDSILRMEQVTPELRLAVEQGYTNQTRNVTGKTKGWVLHGLYCCIWALFNYTTVEQAIAKIVAMGGDTDTNATKRDNETLSLF